MASRFLIFGSVLTPLALYFGGSMGSDYMDRQGWRFFNSGKNIVDTLGTLAKSAKSKDYAGIESYYASDYSGSPLGLTRLDQVEQKDGIRRLKFHSDGGTAGRDAAMAEWRAYLDSFDSIEEVGIHVHRLLKWDTGQDLEAAIRFELIGVPKGAAQAGIDRAYFRMRFDASGGNLKIRQATLMEGERSISATPQFTNVAKAAGIDFLNQYYPAFLTQKLKFG